MAVSMPKGTITKVLSIVAVVGIIVALVIVALPGQDKKYITASFPRTVSLYEGSDVRILGVPVGKVESVNPEGTDVTVKMWYDAKYDVPKDAKALIISPAIVGDRFVQLTPAYKSGAKLDDNAVLTTKSTSTPLELDEIYDSIDKLTVALGPGGADKEGSLTRLLNSTASNFEGQGAQFHKTIENLGKFTGTLDNNKEELFGTVRQIERFVNALAKNDTTVRRFNDSLASAADLLKDERGDLRASLHNLGIAMQAVEEFVKENRDTLSHNIKGLNRSRRCWSSSARPSTRSCRSRPPRWPTSSTPTTRRPGRSTPARTSTRPSTASPPTRRSSCAASSTSRTRMRRRPVTCSSRFPCHEQARCPPPRPADPDAPGRARRPVARRDPRGAAMNR